MKKFLTVFDSTKDCVGLDCAAANDGAGDGMTQQEYADECDVNKILAKYKAQVNLEGYFDSSLVFGDFSQVPTYQEMQDKVRAANELFMELPAAVRKHFDNDPGLFVAGAQTPEGVAFLKSQGLGAVVEPVQVPGEPPKGASSSPAGQAVPTSPKADVKGDEPAGSSKPVK